LETEVQLTTDNQIIEKNIELINKGATEAVAERQELHIEVVNVGTVRSLVERCLNQQTDVRCRRKFKKRTQGNGVSRKERIAVHTRVIRCAVLVVRKEALQGEFCNEGCAMGRGNRVNTDRQTERERFICYQTQIYMFS
jgi:hypothetical protein